MKNLKISDELFTRLEEKFPELHIVKGKEKVNTSHMIYFREHGYRIIAQFNYQLYYAILDNISDNYDIPNRFDNYIRSTKIEDVIDFILDVRSFLYGLSTKSALKRPS